MLAVIGSAAAGWYAGRPEFVDDQLSGQPASVGPIQ
jgi:hypothetical protein